METDADERVNLTESRKSAKSWDTEIQGSFQRIIDSETREAPQLYPGGLWPWRETRKLVTQSSGRQRWASQHSPEGRLSRCPPHSPLPSLLHRTLWCWRMLRTSLVPCSDLIYCSFQFIFQVSYFLGEENRGTVRWRLLAKVTLQVPDVDLGPRSPRLWITWFFWLLIRKLHTRRIWCNPLWFLALWSETKIFHRAIENSVHTIQQVGCLSYTQ